MKTQQLWFTNTYAVEIREQELRALKADEVMVCSMYSGISAGTEMLVYCGQIPDAMSLDMNLEILMDQQSTYPLQYGYATVGHIEQTGDKVDTSLTGKLVFSYQPHASHFITTVDQLVPVPEDIAPLSAIFLANMETAVNLTLDGYPRIGEKALVLGQGVVGLLVSSLLARSPLEGLYALDRIEKRRTSGIQLGVNSAFNPDSRDDLDKLKKVLEHGSPDGGADLVYELSGMPETLNLAIEFCGFDGRIVVGSWYGTKTANLHLGSNFHRNRLQIISSQVSTIAPGLRGRWNRARRFKTSWEMIRKVKPDTLITHQVPFNSAADAYQLLHESPAEVLQVVLVHQD